MFFVAANSGHQQHQGQKKKRAEEMRFFKAEVEVSNSRGSLVTEILFRSLPNPCRMYFGQSGTGTSFSS
jgi:hypothetical protein